MIKSDHWEQFKQAPVIPMAPLIDIVFLTLVFFMTLSVFAQLESQLNISVPKSKETTETVRSPGEIIINITKDGEFFVNQQQLSVTDLEAMLKQVTKMFPDQPVIIRADENAYHKYIINVFDACMRANIWDVSFSTLPSS